MSTPDTDDQLELIPEKLPGGRVQVSAKIGGKLVHLDTLNLTSSRSRKSYANALVDKVPVINPDDVEAELLAIIGKQLEASTFHHGEEIDVSRIIRPELFITDTVCGVTVPIVTAGMDGPSARWMTYLRWENGTRDAIELPPSIELADASRLWVIPQPGVPDITGAASWSAEARARWLRGEYKYDPLDVLNRLCERFGYYLEFPPENEIGTQYTLALWTVLTYAFRCWNAVPYLHLTGPAGSGKSTVFSILERLVFKPVVSSNMTAPALFRTLHERGGTLLLDEAERLKAATPEAGEINSMLLAGYKAGGCATRLEKVGEKHEPREFQVYGPKALACIAGLPPALRSRCIGITMFRAGPDSPKPSRRLDEDPERWQELRDDLHAMTLDHGAEWLALARGPNLCPTGVSGRGWELWQPLLALAHWFGGQSYGEPELLEEMQKHAQLTQADGQDDSIPEADEVLLEILADRIKLGTYPTPGEILEVAKSRDKSAFEKWGARAVSTRLKTYGFVAKPYNGDRRYRWATLANLAKVQAHYGIDLGIDTPE